MANETQLLSPSTLEQADLAMFDCIEELDINVATNKGFKKVPVIWVAGERAYQIKHDKDLRDSAGIMKLPLITIERTGISKSLTDKGSVYGYMPTSPDERGGSQYVLSRRIKQDKTSNFANADAKKLYGQVNFKTEKANEKIVYQTVTIPTPVYSNLSYKINIKTEYQEQMNAIMQALMAKAGSLNYFTVEQDGHEYEVFFQEGWNLNNNVQELGEETRLYQTDIEVKMLVHIIGAEVNQEQPRVVYRENAVEVKFPREYVMVDGVQPPMYTGGSVTGSVAPTGPSVLPLAKSVDFDGVDDYVEVTGINVTDPYTIFIWVKHEDSPNASGTGTFLQMEGSSAWVRLAWESTTDTWQMWAYYSSGFRPNLTSAGTANWGTWQSLALARTADDKTDMWVDGVQGIDSGNSDQPSWTSLRISYPGGSVNTHRVGLVALYLSDQTANIAAMHADPQYDHTSAEHYWKFGDGDTYPTITDNGTVGGWDLTMTNMDASDIVEDYPT